MTQEKWEQIKELVKNKFGFETEEIVPLDDGSGGEAEVVVFKNELGRIKLEWTTKPRTLGEKTVYSKRIGSSVKIDKVYDENETVCFLKVYREIGDDWQEIKADNLF